MVEYAVLAFLIVVGLFVSVKGLRDQLVTNFTNITQCLGDKSGGKCQ